MKLSDQSAFALVKAGIESNSIKLHGVGNSTTAEHAKEAAEVDAEYIKTLLSLLTERTQSTGQ